ncbi:unnamed protein product [Penicillium discolor]
MYARRAYGILQPRSYLRRYNVKLVSPCLLLQIVDIARSHATSVTQGISTLDCDEDSLYRYTSGRWLWNEKEQFSRRYVKFNLAELVKIATQATGSMPCVKVQKLPEGNFDKVFLLTMNDGKQVIAKLPDPNAGPQYFTTASEVKRSHGYCLLPLI